MRRAPRVSDMTPEKGRLQRVSSYESLVDRFEAHRPHLRSVAYRILGSVEEAEDAVQEAWLRLASSDAEQIENIGGWLTTVVARICLNVLRSRRVRREEPLVVHVPDPFVGSGDELDPEYQALLGDSVGLALSVVLETLTPPERLAFVLHDMFSVSFDEIASILERTQASVRQLASRARRRVRTDAPSPDVDVPSQRRVVDAFFAAARDGDFEALVRVLDPSVVLRVDGGSARSRANVVLRGVDAVAAQALTYARLSPFVRPALVHGVAGVVVAPRGEPYAVMAFSVRDGRIVAIDALGDPIRLRALNLGA
jgi:RNA polymerase sigma factor (sigma-70 family)